MKGFIRYGIVPAAIFSFLVIVTLVLLPVVLNLQRYTPRVERYLSRQVDRPVFLGTDLTVTFFPWLSVSSSGLRLGNQPGFRSDDLLRASSFEARIKWLPLLTGKLEFSRFIVDGLVINLERTAGGGVNWRNSAAGSHMASARQLPSFRELFAGVGGADLLVVTNGSLVWNDRTDYTHYELDDLMIILHEYDPGKQTAVELEATLLGQALKGDGKLGPIDFGETLTVPYDLDLVVKQQLEAFVSGRLRFGRELLLTGQLNTGSFSPAIFAHSAPSADQNESAPRQVSFDLQFELSPQHIHIPSGRMELDHSIVDFSLDRAAAEAEFSCAFDSLDMGTFYKMFREPAGLAPELAGVRSLLGYLFAGYQSRGTMHIGRGTLGKFRVEEIKTEILYDKDILQLQPIEARLEDGRFKGALVQTANDSGDRHLRLDFNLQGAEFGKLLETVTGQELLEGKLTAVGVLNVPVLSPNGEEQVEQGPEGHFQLRVGNGQFFTAESGSGTEDGLSFETLDLELVMGKGRLDIVQGKCRGEGGEGTLAGGIDLRGQLVDMVLHYGTVTAAEKDSFLLRGPLSEAGLQRVGVDEHPVGGETLTARMDSQAMDRLLEEKLPVPPEAERQGLVGKSLVDPEVVVRRIGLKPMVVTSESMEAGPVVTGTKPRQQAKVRIHPLREEESFTPPVKTDG